MSRPFRNDFNQRYTKQLFYELWINLPISLRTTKPLFSLYGGVPGYPSFRDEYVNDMDPTGYKTATRLLENYDHLQQLMTSKWFREAREEWDREIAARMEQEAMDTLLGLLRASEEDVKVTERISAAKALLTKSEKILKGPASGRGRPSKEEVAGALKEEARLSKEEQEDLKRIRIVK